MNWRCLFFCLKKEEDETIFMCFSTNFTNNIKIKQLYESKSHKNDGHSNNKATVSNSVQAKLFIREEGRENGT